MQSVKERYGYVSIAIDRDADILLEVTAAYARMRKVHVLNNIAKCPNCGRAFLLRVDDTTLRCPVCGAVYKLVRL
jgi:uncharacterized C2H2 Zn-finger protein